MIVKCFTPYCSDDVIFTNLKLKSNFDKLGIKLTTGDDYTHAIVVNEAMPELSVPKERVIGLAWEPPAFLRFTPQFIQWCQQHVSAYYIGEKGNLPDPFVEHYAYQRYSARLTKPLPPKTKLMSIVFSGKNQLPGHHYRNQLVVECLRRGLPIDIYGYGCGLINVKDPRIKGPFNLYEPFEEYQFTIAVENSSYNDYVSEKFLDCLVTKTIPLYYGCKNIDKHFPNSCIQLSGNIETDLSLIVNVLMNPEKWKEKISMEKYEQYIEETADLAHHLATVFKEDL